MPYVIDGDNLVGTARRRRASPEDRNALVSEISDRLRRTRARVILFFDGAGAQLSLGSLAVRFAAPRSADDAILSEISRAAQPGETIVVTADRDLARRVREGGAAAISPQDFWKRFAAAEPRPGARSSEAQVDVEDWLEWFSDEANRKT